jgi:hypothetical protein
MKFLVCEFDVSMPHFTAALVRSGTLENLTGNQLGNMNGVKKDSLEVSQ